MNFIGLVLHSNTERAQIVLPFKVNKEKYEFSRDKEAKGKEKTLLQRLGAVPGISEATCSGERINLELAPTFKTAEWFPVVVQLLQKSFKQLAAAEIRLDDRRWEKEPHYRNEDDWEPATPGIKVSNADIGVVYTKL